MKTNAHILSKAKSKLSLPSFSFAQNDLPIASYYNVYGSIYLPIPKPIFPVGKNLVFGYGKETEEGDFAESLGVPFKVEFDDPEFEVDEDTWVVIYLSGDKLWREDITSYKLFLIEDPLGGTDRYDTTPYLQIIGEETVGMTILERLRELGKERFWRCQVGKKIGETSYYSAMSEIVSFNVDFKVAQQVDTDNGYPGPSILVDNERGLWFDGTWYYLGDEQAA